MPDWSKCSNVECTIKEKCLRFMINHNSIYQSYHMYQQNEDGTCNDFKHLIPDYANKQGDY